MSGLAEMLSNSVKGTNPLSLIPALFQTVVGASQYFKGLNMSKQATPDYLIPNEYGSMVDTQKNYMLGDMPAETRMRQDVRGNTADAIDTAARYGMIDQNFIGGAANQESQNLANIGMQSSMYRVGEKDKYLNALDLMAQQKLQKQQWETFLPFERTMQTASALMGSGMQNIYGATTSAADYFGNKEMMKQMGYYQNEDANSARNANRRSYQTNPMFQDTQKQAFGMFQSQNPYLF
jgi:hypothetical protein